MIRLAICDDDETYQNIIKQKIYFIFDIIEEDVEISLYSSGEELIADLKNKLFDVILLDIDMPTVSGLNVADAVVDVLPRVNVIFVTNRADLVFEALSCNPFRFIRKSHFDVELEEAIKSVVDKINKDNFDLVFEDGKQTVILPVYDVYFLESRKHYVHIYTNSQEFKLRLKLSYCADKTKYYGFIKIHNSFLVNIRKIKKITSKDVTLDNDKILPISRANSENVKRQYSEMVERYVDGIIV